MDDVPTELCSPELMVAWLAQSNDVLALTDRAGKLWWANVAFWSVTGLDPTSGAALEQLIAHGEEDGPTARHIAAALSGQVVEGAELVLRHPSGARLYLRARTRPIGDRVVWTLHDETAERELASDVKRKSELLDMAQKSGRLGVWEREIPSGHGRWDRHVFNFWGLEVSDRAPALEDARKYVHPDDRPHSRYGESTRTPGRYSQRYRVLRPDGSTRWIHSQWEVKSSPQGTPERAVGIMVDDTVVYTSARALGEAHAQLELAVELGRIAIWRYDLGTRRMRFNDRGRTMLDLPAHPQGMTVEEVQGFIHPDDRPLVSAALERALASDQPTDVEARYRRADESWRYVLTRSVVQRDPLGGAVAVIGVALDVTERVEHLRNTEELARRLEAAARAAHIGIWTTAAQSQETDWNAQMYELFDWPRRQRPPNLHQWIANCVHLSERERVGRLAKDYMRRGQRAFEIEFRTLRRDGSSRWIVLRADVDRSRKDQRRLLGVALDVTENHETLAALRHASERAALITRHAGIGTWEADEEGASERWDAQMFQLRGLPPSATAPDRDEQLALIHPDDLRVVLEAQQGTGRSDHPEAYEFRIRLPSGEYRWLASRAAVVRDERGMIVRRVGVNWDITESKNAQSARQQAELAEREIQAKSQFLSRMSHELRTPLNAVLGFTQLLQIEASQAASPSQALKLAHIRGAGEHLLSLINDVLELSSLESSELKIQLQPVSMADLVEQALPLVEALMAQHEVTVRVGEMPGVALVDPRRMRQVLLNLLTNAIKYNRRGGGVTVQSRVDDGHVCLTVKDTGRGLTSEQMAQLFQPFNRLGIENEGIEGTGIGLTIVKSLVESMGGTVGVSSRRNRGTVFTITLPAHAGASEDLPTTAVTDTPAMTAQRFERTGQLLYIEDNAVNVLLVEELVRSLSGLAIESEPTGQAGIARARELKPDVILVDLQLPDIDGFEVLRRLRKQPETAGTPCVALSANAMPEDIARGLDAGFADYWTKPIDFKAFIVALERLFPAGAAPRSRSARQASDALGSRR